MRRTLKLRTQKRAGGVLVLLAAGCVSLFGQSPQEAKNQELATNWYREVVLSGHVDQASKYMADDYVEHDPRISSGKSGFMRYYQNASARPAEAKQITAFGQGDYVVIVWSRADKDPKSSTPYNYTTYDVVRIKNGKIQEHWNNAKQNTKW
jgi:predicted SnoaL-like aldol condensation-catalyzing enzyme